MPSPPKQRETQRQISAKETDSCPKKTDFCQKTDSCAKRQILAQNLPLAYHIEWCKITLIGLNRYPDYNYEGATIDRSSFITSCDALLKLVRTEYGFTQEEMAHVLGLSKKTLVDIEKERRTLGWTGSLAFCLVFQDSEVLAGVFGGQPTDMILAMAYEGRRIHYRKASGSRLWWSTLYENENFRIQQNIISQHYRLLTIDGRRVASSFDLDDLTPLYNGLQR